MYSESKSIKIEIDERGTGGRTGTIPSGGRTDVSESIPGQNHFNHEVENMGMRIITISREYGSGGRTIG